MEGREPLSPPSAGSVSGFTSSAGVPIDPTGINDDNPREMLLQGTAVVVRMDPQSLLKFIMQELGSQSQPVFTELDAGANGYKFSVKLDVSEIRAVTAVNPSEALVVGETSFNKDTAETKAAVKAMKYLHDKHLVKVLDFSSRVADRLEASNSYNLVVDAMRSIKKIFTQWEMASLYCENLSVNLEGKEWDQVIYGELSDKGHVYSLPANSLSAAVSGLGHKTSEVRAELNGIQEELSSYETKNAHRRQAMIGKMYFHTVDLSPKEVLEYVLSYFQLDDAKFTVTPGRDAFVHCTVEMNFPELEIYKYGGNITIPAQGSNYGEAYENGAMAALLFIEKHFPIKIIDCNFSKRKKATMQQEKLVSMLSRILQLGDQLKKMWCQLTTEISGHHALFSLDPSSLFLGPSSQALIEAFNCCASGLQDAVRYNANSYAFCALEFEMMLKLNWQLLLSRINLHK